MAGFVSHKLQVQKVGNCGNRITELKISYQIKHILEAGNAAGRYPWQMLSERFQRIPYHPLTSKINCMWVSGITD